MRSIFSCQHLKGILIFDIKLLHQKRYRILEIIPDNEYIVCFYEWQSLF